MTKLRRPWQQASLNVFLTRAILNDPGKNQLRKMWLGWSTQVHGVHSQSWTSRLLLYHPFGAHISWRRYCKQGKEKYMSLIASLDSIIRTNTNPGHDTLS